LTKGDALQNQGQGGHGKKKSEGPNLTIPRRLGGAAAEGRIKKKGKAEQGRNWDLLRKAEKRSRRFAWREKTAGTGEASQGGGKAEGKESILSSRELLGLGRRHTMKRKGAGISWKQEGGARKIQKSGGSPESKEY